MIEPDFTRLLGSWDAVNWKLVKGTNNLYLRAGFWLSVLVMISEDHTAGIRYELTDCNHAPLYATAEQRDYYESRGMDERITGIRLPQPLPNLNAAQAYVLRADADKPCIVKVLQLWHPAAP